MNWEYVASLFDHKGNINTIKVKGRKYLQIRFYSQNLNVLQEIKGFLGYGNLYIKELSKKNPKWQDKPELAITAKEDIFMLLAKMLPFLVAKKQDVEDILIRHPLFESFDLNEKLKKEHVSYVG